MQTLQKVINKNIKSGAIWPSQSPKEALVLFVKKKNGDLRLYINYQGLNKITCKDCYPIPLISNLLDAPKKVKIYTKIDLRNTYYLVCIAEGNK